jgi:hypothetical protein
MKSISLDKNEEKIIIKSKEYVFKSNDNLNLISENKSSLKKIINGISILYLLYGRALYIKSLKGCDQSEFTCLNDLKLITDGIQNCLNSIGYFIFVLFLIHMNFCSFYILIILIIIYIELAIRDHGENFLHHGKLNLFALFSLTIMGEIIVLFIILYKNIFKKKKFFFLFLISSFFLVELIIILNNIKNDYYCKDWNKSLNNSYINNDPSLYPCKINIPSNKCLVNIFGPFFDFSKIFNIKCEKRRYNEKNILINNSNLKNKTEVKKIGYPITIGNKEEINGEPILYSETLYEFVKNNLIDMDDKEQIGKLDENKRPETIVDFSNSSYGKIEININYNEKLSKERKLLEKVNSNNVLFIFMDNLSRVHFYRQYKKTKEFLKQFLTFEGYSNKINKEQKYHGFEFIKYQKFDGATLQNALPMFSGVYFDHNNIMISIVKDFQKNGYITCNVQDICHKELMSMEPLKNYTYIEFDHESAAINCEPNVYKPGYGLLNGDNSVFRKCLYGKESFDYSLEYGKKFWISYKNNKRFLRIVNTYSHEYSYEKAKYTDDSLYNFLKELFETDLLKNTTIFIAADHGFFLMGIYKILNSKDFIIETNLPLFFLIVPDKKNMSYEQQYSEIIKNQQTLVTPFDIFYTLRYIIYEEDYKKSPLNGNCNDGEYLFKNINPKERTCKKYQQMDKSTCQCINY